MLRKVLGRGTILLPRLSSCSQNAGLKAVYGGKYPYSKPFDYQNKSYNLWASFFDQTTHRFNENSKVIVVEGNVGVGKAEFAKKLAEGFNLKYFPPVSHDSCFIEGQYGMDLRSLNDIYPASCRFYDLNDFYNDPHPEKGKASSLALRWYVQKYYDYARALKHLLSTGQGVVMTTSVFSDMVYVEALKRLGWCSKDFYSFYQDYRSNSICEFYRPHLTIHLDAPFSTILQRASQKHRNVSSQYLQAVADSYKDIYLPFARKHGELVEINWTEKASDVDMDTIIEEMQLLRLDTSDPDDVMFSDWSRTDDHELLKLRQLVDRKENLSWFLDREMCDELIPSADDRVFIDRINNQHPVLSGVPPGYADEFGYKPAFK